MKYIISSFLIVFVLFSCNKHEKIYDEVMEIHDDAMAKMDQIMKLKSQLKQNIEKFENDTLNDHSTEIEKMSNLTQDLEEADEAMMNWMREFHNDYEDVAKNKIMDYLEDQKERITEVGKQMNEAIAEADKYLNADE